MRTNEQRLREMLSRLSLEATHATRFEECADKIYRQLPEWAKW